MKKIRLLLLLFIISYTSYSQNEIEIPKGTNKIIMRTELNEKDNVKLLLKILKDNDFEIGKIDTTIFQIQTIERNMKNSIINTDTYILNFNLYNGYITVTGRMIKSILGVSSYEIKKGGMVEHMKQCFNELNELCLKLVSQDKIEYTVKN
jgi:hypothetical protein